jgi:hypothetical protein
MKDITVIMMSIGDVTNTKLPLLYVQIIIHGIFCRLGKYCAIKGRITSMMPATIKITPISVKGG